eukprot:5530590-Amphidinium_carterae.2
MSDVGKRVALKGGCSCSQENRRSLNISKICCIQTILYLSVLLHGMKGSSALLPTLWHGCHVHLVLGYNLNARRARVLMDGWVGNNFLVITK